MIKTAIVILNYNGLSDTLECLESLRKLEKQQMDVEIIIVDNGSQDGSQETLSKIKDIEFIRNEENLGFAGGNNKGIKLALERNADFVLIINNDTLLDAKALTKLLDAANSAQLVSPKIYFAKGFEFHKDWYKKEQLGKVIWYAGAKIDWQNIIGQHIGVNEVDRGQFSERCEIDFTTGACMLVKRTVFEKIGFFDEKYFLYLEDMDFCVRAKKAKYKIIFEPQAIIWHKNASSAEGSGSKLQDYFITRNRLFFAIKYASLKTKFAVIRQIIGQLKNPIKRKAFLDFLTLNFGKGSYLP